MNASPLAVWRSCGMTSEQGAESIERELPDRRTPGERTVTLQVQREIHGVEAAIRERDAPVPFERRVKGADVVADVVPGR